MVFVLSQQPELLVDMAQQMLTVNDLLSKYAHFQQQGVLWSFESEAEEVNYTTCVLSALTNA